METLIALSQIVSQQKVNKIDVLGPDQNPDLLINKFYNGLILGKIKSDNDALSCLYGNAADSMRKMQAVKKRLADKLINTMFFIDAEKGSQSDLSRFQVKNYLSFGVIKMLKYQNQLHLSAKLAEKCIKRALKYDMIDLAYILCQDILQYYSILNYDKKKASYYDALDDHISQLFLAEKDAKKCFIYYGAIINQNKTETVENLPNSIRSKMTSLSKIQDSINSYDFNFHFRNAQYFEAWLNKDLDKMETIAQSAIQFFEQKNGFLDLGLFSFIQKLGFVYERRSAFNQAIAVYETALNLNLTDGGTSWYNIRGHLFDAHMQQRHYPACQKYLQEAVEHKSFKKLHRNYREPWIIKSAFMQLLIKMKKVDAYSTKTFSLNKFRNNVELFSKDKRGLNISIILVQALHHLVQNQREKFEDKLDALGQYAFRYLRNDDTYRSNVFIRIITKLPEVNYHPVRWQKHTERLISKLHQSSSQIGIQTKEIEIIKYEHLLDLIMEMLSVEKIR